MMSRSDRIYRQTTDPVSGLELDAEHGYISVILPETTTNLCTNPSFEYGVTTGWSAVNASAIALTYNWQAYGAAGLSVTPNASQDAGARWGTIALTAGTTYTASITIQGDPGKIYYIKFADNAGSTLLSRKWIATGLKQRIWVTYTAASSANHYIYITRDARYADTRLFYMDGLQMEAKSYPTTYADGDQVGFVVGEAAFWWNGTTGASTSTRSVNTRAGGREMNLLDLGFRLLTIVGLGLSGLVDQFLPIPGLGGMPQGTGTTVREFQLVGSIVGDGPRHLMSIRDDLIDAFKPDAALKPQPLILRYQHCDEDGDPDSDSLDIQCKFLQGLEGNTGNAHQENLALAFRQYVPFVQGTYSQGIELGFQTSIANANRIIKRGTDNIWVAMSTGISGGAVNAFATGPDALVYVGGFFTNANTGVAGTDYIMRWSGAAWEALQGGMNQRVYALAFGPDGTLYAGGDFTVAGIVAANYIAKWNGSAWSALGTGMNGTVHSLAVGPDGFIYAGGDFTTAGGAAIARIARWNGATWQSLGDADGAVNALVFDKAGNLYAGGAFTTIGGTAANRIAKWNGVNWSILSIGADGVVNALAIGSEGSLYAGGSFTRMGGMPLRGGGFGGGGAYIARWTGTYWSALGAGVNGLVYALSFGPDNKLYVGGAFTSAGGNALADQVAAWNGVAWMPLDVDLPGTAVVNTILYDRFGALYLGYDVSGTATSSTVTVPDLGSTTAYPIIKFTGPGTIYPLRNYTVDKTISFNLTLLTGEVAVLNLDPLHPSFISNFRGDIWGSAIEKSSDLDFPLMPGNNKVSTFLYGGTTAATHVVMYYQPLHWSIDGAILK